MPMWKDFKAFLIKQNAIALAIAVVIGAALDTVVKAIVAGFIMPIVTPITTVAGGSYEKLTWRAGPFVFQPGIVLAALVNFVIVGFVAWRLSKLFVRESPSAKPATKSCPYCRMGDLDLAATRCPHCTSAVDAAPVTAAVA